MPTETTLTINADGTATLHVVGFSNDVLNTTVPYELDGNTLTLKQATTYANGAAPTETKTDIGADCGGSHNGILYVC